MAQENFYYPHNSIALKYIDQQIVKRIIKAYERGDQVGKIKADFPDAPITNSLYVNLPYELTNEKCICGHYIYRKVSGRTSYKENPGVCPNCWHDEQQKFCECQYCSEKRLTAEKKENNVFLERWLSYCESLSQFKRKINDLDLNDILDLLTLFDHDNLINYTNNQISFDLVHTAHNRHCELLHLRSFNPELTGSLQSLIDRHILVPVEELTSSRINLLKAYSDLSKSPFYLAKWKFNIEDDPKLVKIDIKTWISQRLYSEGELNFFWLELYHNELYQYLKDQAKENLNLALTDLEVLSISEYLAELYPLSKAFNLIYFSVSSALRFQLQKKPKEKVLRDYLVNKILDMAEQKKENQHIIKDFNRPANIPIAIKSQIIRKNIFKLDADHFTLTKASSVATVAKL
ncbi:hypothetical protein BN1088_1431744 [Sphingobacterium sp. PM2-P1-29]|nr:hypothetical protein BN1088_1431744 [Sphingobacterium sp. PM2-P1-29]